MVVGGEFPGAVARYARAVDVAGRARAEWEGEGRPIVARNPNGASGVHPLLKAMMDWERAAGDRGAELGLTPASAKRIWPQRGRGRPVGSNSAPDRRLPPLELIARPGVRVAGEPDRLNLRVNRARGHQVED